MQIKKPHFKNYIDLGAYLIFIAIINSIFGLSFISLIILLTGLAFVFWVVRNPIRVCRKDDNKILSPVDGIVNEIREISSCDCMFECKEIIISSQIYDSMLFAPIHGNVANDAFCEQKNIDPLWIAKRLGFGLNLDWNFNLKCTAVTRMHIKNSNSECYVESIGWTFFPSFLVQNMLSVNAGEQIFANHFGQIWTETKVFIPKNHVIDVVIGQSLVGGETSISYCI